RACMHAPGTIHGSAERGGPCDARVTHARAVPHAGRIHDARRPVTLCRRRSRSSAGLPSVAAPEVGAPLPTSGKSAVALSLWATTAEQAKRSCNNTCRPGAVSRRCYRGACLTPGTRSAAGNDAANPRRRRFLVHGERRRVWEGRSVVDGYGLASRKWL